MELKGSIMKLFFRSSTLLVFLLCAGGLAQTATAPSGSGTEGDPYQIGSLENLYWIAASDVVVPSPARSSRWAAQYRQTGNIDASATGLGGDWGTTGWTPIGNIIVYFTGTYDGNYYTIDGLFISRPDDDMQSLFGYTVGAAFTNIGMLNVNITGRQYPSAIVSILIGSTMNNCYSTGTISGRYQTGGLAGSLSTNGAISNSYSACSVTGTLDYTGGLVGRISEGSISRCYFTGIVTSLQNYSGGLVGDCMSGTTISNSYNIGSVSGVGYVGGLSGRITSGTITNCYSIGSVSGTSSVGGLIGLATTATTTNSFWDTQTSGQSGSAGGTGKTTAEMKAYETYYFQNGWDFLDETLNGTNNVWGLNPTENNGYPFLSHQGFTHAPEYLVISYSASGISGTTAALIGSAGDLGITQHGFCWSTSAAPTVDDAKIELGAVSQIGSFTYTATGLVPATTYYVRTFSVKDGLTQYGTELSFDSFLWSGSGTEIDPFLIANKTDLWLLYENPSEWTKQFKQTADIYFLAADYEFEGDFYNNGEGWAPIGDDFAPFQGTYGGDGHFIDNLFINRPDGYYQGLFGWINGDAIIKNLSVTNIDVTGYGSVGGIAGWNGAIIENCHTSGSLVGTEMTGGIAGGNNGTIDSCDADCSITGGTTLGGLVGYSEGGTINDCSSTGDISGTEYVGGLVGSTSNTSILCSSSIGAVTGDLYVGGFLGYNYVEDSVSRCFSTGAVIGNLSVGGFAGYNEGAGTISNCYSTGDVTRSTEELTSVGGFIGENYGGIIEYCYSAGSVTGSDPADKGFIAFDDGGTHSHNFFNSTTSLHTSGIGAVAKTMAEMTTRSTFVDEGWDESIWCMDGDMNSGQPYFVWQNPEGTPLSVELEVFSAFLKGNRVELFWQTATETNNHGFEIEKKNNAKNSEFQSQQWLKIGFVPGNGTTSSPQSYSFVDPSLKGRVSYRLKQIDRDGKFRYSQILELNTNAAVTRFALEQNYPNPFNPTTTIEFTLAKDAWTTLEVYDMLGRSVATLVNEELKAGTHHQVIFHAEYFASGVYFTRLQSGERVALKKIMLMK